MMTIPGMPGLRIAGIGLAAVLFGLSGPSEAQRTAYRCVDARGVTFYTDKPLPNCKRVQVDHNVSKSPEGAAQKGAKGSEGKAPQTVATTPKERHCAALAKAQETLKEEKRGDPAANQHRSAGIEKALARDCAS